MAFRIYNSLAREKQRFEPLEPGVVRMYNCGPTIYNRQHIGNFRAFLFAHVLRSWLEYLGYDVRQVMNITDVGHLQNDADEGEDKVEAQARREGLDPWKISREYGAQFFADLKELGVTSEIAHPWASDHIPEMIEIIERLIELGHAYVVGGDVYFDVTTFARYGRLSGNRLEDLEAGARIEVRQEKRNPADFALWKSDPLHIMKWETRFGPDGFPGWHIECSAMARKHLGDRIDIHTGGEDNIFPHHECEIAQTECFTGEPFATYWMHTKFLQIDGGKMSKSLGNVYTIDDVKERGYSTRALRYALIRGHYRQPLNFTWDAMKDAASALENLDNLVVRLRRAVDGQGVAPEPGAGAERVAELQREFEDAMNDDLSVSRALPALFALRSELLEGRIGSSTAVAGLRFVERANGVLGVIEMAALDLDEEIQALVDKRQELRAQRAFAEADGIRDELLRRGIVLEDTPEGVAWRRG